MGRGLGDGDRGSLSRAGERAASPPASQVLCWLPTFGDVFLIREKTCEIAQNMVKDRPLSVNLKFLASGSAATLHSVSTQHHRNHRNHGIYLYLEPLSMRKLARRIAHRGPPGGHARLPADVASRQGRAA